METNCGEQIGSCVNICWHEHNYIQDPSVKDSQVRIREMAAKSSTDVYLDVDNMCKKYSLQPPPSDCYYLQPWYGSPAETAYQDLLNLPPHSAVYNKPTSSILIYKINTPSSQAAGAHPWKPKAPWDHSFSVGMSTFPHSVPPCPHQVYPKALQVLATRRTPLWVWKQTLQNQQKQHQWVR